MSSPDHGPGFILCILDKFTGAWVKKYSLAAIPLLRPTEGASTKSQQFNRDVFITVMLISSISGVTFCHWLQPSSGSLFVRLLAAFALYRSLDLLLTTIRTGVFFSFRGDTQINKQPIWRIRRLLAGFLLAYVELVFWFAVIYLFIGLEFPCQFVDKIEKVHQGLNLSFTTITTIGYGRYTPDRMFSVVLAFMQALIGIILLTTVFGALVALLTKDESQTMDLSLASNYEREQASWLKPLCAFSLMRCFIFPVGL